jgi:hypothetical protein
MAEATKENTFTTRNMVLVHTHGLTVENTQANGSIASVMAMVR